MAAARMPDAGELRVPRVKVAISESVALRVSPLETAVGGTTAVS